ncbi:MAG: phage minor head protein [Chitinispirillia bacterium]|nr:phage minor head protein [Chitinispirillia bacterium]MCL2268589.1 phage minor head protein [Chitinispirillia bacterium]
MSDPKILLDAFKQKPAAAIEYMKRKGYGFSWNWYDMWKDTHARAFTVAKAMKVDLLRDIRKAVEKALETGMTFQQFQKEIRPKLSRHGWLGDVVDKKTGEVVTTVGSRRLKTIYRTNLQTAYMAGRYKGQMEAAEDLPYLQYLAVMDGKTRDGHRAMHGRIFRADDPIWNEFYPPNGWGCRCRVRSLSDKQLQRAGVQPESSEGRVVEREVVVGKGENARIEKVSGVNLGNGKVMWTGPGWNYNAGKEAWMPNLSVYHPDDAKAFIRDSFSGPDYKRFFDAKGMIGGAIPIAILPDDYMEAIGAKTHTVRLSAETLWKNTSKHPELSMADYQQTQLHLEQADAAVIVADGNGAENLVVFNRVGDDNYKTVFKTARTNKGEVFLLSMHLVTENNVRNVLQKAVRVIRGKI